MTYWGYLMASIRTHAAEQILDASAPRARERVQIAPGTKPKLAEIGSASMTWSRPSWCINPPCVNPDLLIASGQLPIEGPSNGKVEVPGKPSSD
jgi:hypothetical protein